MFTQKSMKKILLCIFTAGCFVNASGQEAVWLCSKTVTAQTDQQLSQKNDNDAGGFSLASSGTNPDVINISVMDLMDIYSGDRVTLGGKRLSACFMRGEGALNAAALRSLGLKSSVSQTLARKSAIVQSHLYLVTDEEEMMACIKDHFPAVGYAHTPIETDEVAPCF